MVKLANRLKIDTDTLIQRIKYVIYTAIAISFVKTVYEDTQVFLLVDSSAYLFFDYVYDFQGTLDGIAWAGLIILLELETYILGDNTLPSMDIMRQVGRYLCYGIVAYSTYTYVSDLIDYRNYKANQLEYENLCEAYEDEYTDFNWNEEYTPITEENCNILAEGDELYDYDPDQGIITDRKGIERAIMYAWSSLVEMALWIIIMSFIEIKLRLENNRYHWPITIRSLNVGSNISYAIMMGIICSYWVYVEQYYDTYDEFMWIIGYYLIELNLKKWHKENQTEMSKAWKKVIKYS